MSPCPFAGCVSGPVNKRKQAGVWFVPNLQAACLVLSRWEMQTHISCKSAQISILPNDLSLWPLPWQSKCWTHLRASLSGFVFVIKIQRKKKCAFNFDPPSDPWCPQLCRRSEKDMSGLRQTLLFFHRQSSQWVFSFLGFRSNEWVCLVCNLSLSLIKAPCLEACLLPLGCSYLWAAMFLLCFAWYLECKCWLKWTC